MFLKSKAFLRTPGHWKKHGSETFAVFEKLEKWDNIARWSARNRRATKVIFFKICAHYGKNAPLRAHREESGLCIHGELAMDFDSCPLARPLLSPP